MAMKEDVRPDTGADEDRAPKTSNLRIFTIAASILLGLALLIALNMS